MCGMLVLVAVKKGRNMINPALFFLNFARIRLGLGSVNIDHRSNNGCTSFYHFHFSRHMLPCNSIYPCNYELAYFA